MLKFIIGLFIGSIIGFAVCAICSMAGSDEYVETDSVKETGEENARSK